MKTMEEGFRSDMKSNSHYSLLSNNMIREKSEETVEIIQHQKKNLFLSESGMSNKFANREMSNSSAVLDDSSTDLRPVTSDHQIGYNSLSNFHK